MRRPFNRAILNQARKIAARYQVVLWFEDGEWYGHGPELPTTYGDGKTPDKCVANTRDGFAATVAYMLERGRRPRSRR